MSAAEMNRKSRWGGWTAVVLAVCVTGLWGQKPKPAGPARFGVYTPFRSSCPRPVLEKADDRSVLVAGHLAVLAKPGDNMELTANTSLPAQVTFFAGQQQAQAVSSSLNPNKLNQTQGYMATLLIVTVPSMATGSTQPVAGWVEVSNRCGTSNRVAIEIQGAPAGTYRAGSKAGKLSPGPLTPPRFRAYRGPQAANRGVAPSWTGVIAGAPAYASFWLNTGRGPALRVLAARARYGGSGGSASFATLKAGMRVKVSGILSYGKIMATEVDVVAGHNVFPSSVRQAAAYSPISATPTAKRIRVARSGVHPILKPLRLAALHLTPAHDLRAITASQTLIRARVGGIQHYFPNVTIRKGADYSPQPYNPNQHFGGYQVQGNNSPATYDLAPVASMFISGDRYGDMAGGNTSIQPLQVASATFFSDPDPNWATSSTVPGLFGSSMPLSTGTVATTLATGNASQPNPITPIGFVPVTSPGVNLVIPCYYLEGYGADIYDHAHFEVKVEYQGATPGSWQTLTEAALDWGDTNGYNASSGTPAATNLGAVNMENGKGYAWTIPIVVPSVATTLRVDVYSALYQSLDQQIGNYRVNPNQPDWSFPGSAGITGNAGVAANQQANFPLSNGTIINGSRHLWLASSPFQIVLLPTQLLTADDMPYGIIYAPPGNESNEQFESFQSYGISTGFSVATQNSTQIANVQGTNFTLGAKVSVYGVSVGGGVTLSSTSTQTSGMTSTDNQTESLSLTTTWGSGWEIDAPSNPKLPASDALQTSEEPFWSDHIIVVPHPIYSIWNYPSGQGGFTAAQLVAYDQNAEPVSIRHLAEGASGSGYSDGNLQLSAADCAALLALDPFYSGGWQGATPPAGRAVPAGSNPSDVNGADNMSWLFESKTLAQSTQGTSQSQGVSQGQGSGSGTSVSFNIGGSGAAFQNSQTTLNTITTTYTATQSSSTGNGIQVKGKVADSGVLPANIQVWLDTVFGGVMFQDPNEPRFTITGQGMGRQPNASEVVKIRHAPHWVIVRH